MSINYGKSNAREFANTKQDRMSGLSRCTATRLVAKPPSKTQLSNLLAKRSMEAALLMLLGIVSSGCASMSPSLHIINHLPDGRSNQYQEKFKEAYFTVDGSSQIELVLRRADRGSVGGRDDLVQVVHVRTFWRSIPGITVAESSQINATITYAITRGAQTSVLRGAGSVLIRLNKRGDVLTGTIERAIVKPIAQAEHQAFFDKVELSGQFTAFKDRRRAIRISNELEALTSSAASMQ